MAELNAGHAAVAANVTPEAVVARIRSKGPPAVEALRALDDAGLQRTAPLAAGGGAVVTAAQIAAGPIIGQCREHLEAFKSATAP